MVERFKQFVRERKWSMLALAIAVLIVAVCGWAVCREGIWYKNSFLSRQEENVWKGKVLGEETTVIRTVNEDRYFLEIICETGKKTYTVEGEPVYEEKIRLYEDGEQVFSGSYVGGILLNENGEPQFSFGVEYSTGGELYVQDGGESVLETPLHLSKSAAVSMALEPDETTRGMPPMILFEIIILAAFFTELWWPETFFRWEVGRFVSGDAEPSDDYLGRRMIGLVLTAGMFFVMLGMSFMH